MGYQNQQRWDFYLRTVFLRRPTFPVLVQILGGAVAFGQVVRGRNRDAWAFLLLWALFPLFLYSSFSSRVPHYIAPIDPPLAILSAQGLAWSSIMTVRLLKPFSLTRNALIGAVCVFLLTPCYFLVGSYLRHTIALVSITGRKLEIEQIVNAFKADRQRGPARAILFNMDSFLASGGTQFWCFKFYLHQIHEHTLRANNVEEVSHEANLPGPLWVVAPISYKEQLIQSGGPCEVRPFVHPEGERSHYRGNDTRKGLGQTQFVLVRYQC